MSIAGVIATALRQDAPYQAEIAMGAQLIMDFQGARSGRRPYYWYRGTRYTSPEKIPGWSFSRNSEAYAEDSAGNLIKFPANMPRVTDRGLLVEEARTNKVTAYNANPTEPDGFVGNPVGMTKGGDAASILSVVSDPAAIAAAGIGGVATSGKLYKLDNSAGTGNAYVTLGGASLTAGVAHTISAWARSGNGNLVRLLFNISGTSVNIGQGGLQRFSVTTAGANVSDKLQVLCFPGAVAYFVLPQIEEGGFVTSPIVTAGSAATRAADNASVTGLAAMLGQFRTNKVTAFNANPSVTTNTTFVNANNGLATYTLVSDAAALSSANLSAYGPNVFKIDNTLGDSEARLQISGAVGVISPQVASAYVRGGTGRISINGSGATFTSSASYVRRADARTPDSTSRTFNIFVDVGQVVYLILPQLEDGSVPTDPIITQGAAASAGNPVTLVAWVDLPAVTVTQRIVQAAESATAVTNRAYLNRSNTDAIGSVTTGGTGSSGVNASGKGGARVLKVAQRVRASAFSGAVDGATTSPASISFAAPSNMSVLLLGTGESGTAPLNGYIQRVGIYGDVDDAQLQRLAA